MTRKGYIYKTSKGVYSQSNLICEYPNWLVNMIHMSRKAMQSKAQHWAAEVNRIRRAEAQESISPKQNCK